MAREKREISPTGMYHVLLRGIDELFSEKADFDMFIDILNRYFENKKSKLFGYALMKNRVHLIISEEDSKISLIVKSICTSYARYFNRVHDEQGKLFYDRYKSEPVYDKNNLKELRGFLKSVPSDYSGGLSDAVKNSSLFWADDYCRMTDEELKEYIEVIFACNISGMTKNERQEFAEQLIEGKQISAGRVYKILDLGRKITKKNKPDTLKEKVPDTKIEKQEEQRKNNDLSVWLL